VISSSLPTTSFSSSPAKGQAKTRLKDRKFPVEFQIGPDDVMMAGEDQFIGPFSIKAKLSRHGSASTAPGDLIGYGKGTDIKMGSKDVQVVLSEVAGADAGASHGKPEMAAPEVGSATNPHAQAKATTAASKESITGEIVLSDTLAASLKKQKFSLVATDALFVVAKDAKSADNKPAAVARIGDLGGKSFPIPFALSPEDTMGAGSFQGPFLLKAKLSRQGGVETLKGDLTCEYTDSQPIKAGQKGVRIVLRAMAE
jgi:hypothetical protein